MLIIRVCVLLCLFITPIQAQTSGSEMFQAMKWRMIGPFRGGRSVAGCGVVGDPRTYYMGTTGGGLWKTDDMGISWRNVSDGYFKTGSVGAVAVAESDPNVVYIGTGETHTVQEFVELAFAHVGLDWKQYVVTDPRLVRPALTSRELAAAEAAGFAALVPGVCCASTVMHARRPAVQLFAAEPETAPRRAARRRWRRGRCCR